MQVETYETTEVDEKGGEDFADPAAIEAFSARAETLGLHGQARLVKALPMGGATAPSIMRFRPMTGQERFVFGTLFSQQTKIEEFADSAIPMRVLDAYEKARPHFRSFEVWSSPTRDAKDPVLVAYPEDRWHGGGHLIARWGDALVPFADLAAAAARRFLADLKATLSDIKAQVGAHLASVESMSVEDVMALAASRSAQTPSYFPNFLAR